MHVTIHFIQTHITPFVFKHRQYTA